MYCIRVLRYLPAGGISIEYEGPSDGNRVETRLTMESLQDSFDRECEPLRAFMLRDGMYLEAAYCLREARE